MHDHHHDQDHQQFAEEGYGRSRRGRGGRGVPPWVRARWAEELGGGPGGPRGPWAGPGSDAPVLHQAGRQLFAVLRGIDSSGHPDQIEEARVLVAETSRRLHAILAREPVTSPPAPEQ